MYPSPPPGAAEAAPRPRAARPASGRSPSAASGGPGALDPGQHQAVVLGREHVGDVDVGDLAEPAEPGGLGAEEVDRCVRPGLHQGRRAGGEPEPGGVADVAAGERGGGHDGGAEQRLGALRDRPPPRHVSAPPRPGPAAPARARPPAPPRSARPSPAPAEAVGAPEVRVRHVARAVRVVVAEHRHPGPRAARPAASSVTSRWFWASMASTRSQVSNQPGSIWRARCRVASYPARVSRSAARSSIGWPTCHGPVPALTTSTSSASPASATRSASTTAAIGERQMLPRHTTAIRYGVIAREGIHHRAR